ncbi:MAG: hypothetical protein R3A11_09145 [Bdellovibrionota bacterium]
MKQTKRSIGMAFVGPISLAMALLQLTACGGSKSRSGDALSFSTDTFVESSINDGRIENTIRVQLKAYSVDASKTYLTYGEDFEVVGDSTKDYFLYAKVISPSEVEFALAGKSASNQPQENFSFTVAMKNGAQVYKKTMNVAFLSGQCAFKYDLTTFNNNQYSYVYNSQGKTLLYERITDTDSNGIPDHKYSDNFNYNSSGQVTSKITTIDNNLDNIIDYKQTTTNTYDVQGNLLNETYELDSNADGNLEQKKVTVYTYNSTNQRTSQTFSHDKDGNGTSDSKSLTTYTYNANGQIETSERKNDLDANGTFDNTNIEIFTYNAKGEKISYEYKKDNNANGTYNFQALTTYTYNTIGNLLMEDTLVDNNFDGTFEWRSTYTYSYDANGNRLSKLHESDSDNNGSVDYKELYTYTYDARKNQLSENFKEYTNGITLSQSTFYTREFDLRNRMISSILKSDSNGDGTVDSISTSSKSFDPKGNLTKRNSGEDQDANGTIDFSTEDTWTHDDQNLEISYESKSFTGTSLSSTDSEQITRDSDGNPLTRTFLSGNSGAGVTQTYSGWKSYCSN